MKNIIYRDDDVSVHTDAYLFRELHKQFIANNKVHTVAVIMKDLWENQAIFWYLATAPLLEIGLHGWEHKDYSRLSYEKCHHDLWRSLMYWEENVKRMFSMSELPENKKIKIYFATWNKEGENIKRACERLGLRFCNVKKGDWEGNKIYSFHWWQSIDSDWRLKFYE